MKILLLPVTCLLVLMLSGCSMLGAIGQVLASPLSLLNGMAQAVGRTVTDASTPTDKPASNAEAIAQRGAEIAARGTYGGSVGAATPDATVGAAHR